MCTQSHILHSLHNWKCISYLSYSYFYQVSSQWYWLKGPDKSTILVLLSKLGASSNHPYLTHLNAQLKHYWGRRECQATQTHWPKAPTVSSPSDQYTMSCTGPQFCCSHLTYEEYSWIIDVLHQELCLPSKKRGWIFKKVRPTSHASPQLPICKYEYKRNILETKFLFYKGIHNGQIISSVSDIFCNLVIASKNYSLLPYIIYIAVIK